jgi:hypothetical protein
VPAFSEEDFVMQIEYGSPEIQIVLSNQFLTKFFASQAAVLFPCPEDLDPDTSLFTDLVINEIVAVRADDTTALDALKQPADSAITTLGQAFNFPTTQSAYVAFRDGALGDTLRPPAVFLIVSGSARAFKLTDLRAAGDVAPIPPTQFQRQNPSNPALLFSVRVIRTTQPSVIQAIRFELVGLWNSAATSKTAIDGIKNLKARLPPQDVSFDKLTPLLGAVGLPSQILNIGITTDLWQQGVTPPKVGLRIGIDARGPLKMDGWTAFYSGNPWLADEIKLDTGDLAVLVDGGVTVDDLTTKLESLSLPHLSNVFLEAPTVEVSDGKIILDVAARDGDVPLGDFIAILTPVAAQRNMPQSSYLTSYLDVTACARFDENPSGALLIWFLTTMIGTIIGAGIGFGAGAIVGAIIGTFVGISVDLALSSSANDAIQQQFGGNSPSPLGLGGMTCGAVDGNGCLNCSLATQLTLAGIGDLLMSASAWQKSGIGLAWRMRDPAVGAGAKLRVEVADDWNYDVGICHTPSRDPRRGILLANDGDAPLKVCWVGQDASQPNDVGVLQVTPQILGSQAAPALVIAPGRATRLGVTAMITGNAAYVESNPPPLLLRVLSTGGAVEIDLNSPNSAVSQDAQANQKQAQWGQLLCDMLKEHQPPNFLRQIPFSDPIPFSGRERVIERLDVRLTGVATSDRLLAFDLGGLVLGVAHTRQGVARLVTADERAPAKTHRFSQISVARERLTTKEEAQAGTRNYENERQQGGKSERRTVDATLVLERTLYVQRLAMQTFGGIRNSLQLGEHIVLVSDDGLRIGSVKQATIGAWQRLALRQPSAVTRWREYIAVGTLDGLVMCTEKLDIVFKRRGIVRSLAGAADYIIVSDGTALRAVLFERGDLRIFFTLNVPNVSKLISIHDEIFALANGSVLHLKDRTLVDTGLRAREILQFDADHGAAVCGTQMVVFDRAGMVTMELSQAHRLAHFFEWPHAALEVNCERGMVTVFDRITTVIDYAAARQTGLLMRSV